MLLFFESRTHLFLLGSYFCDCVMEIWSRPNAITISIIMTVSLLGTEIGLEDLTMCYQNPKSWINSALKTCGDEIIWCRISTGASVQAEQNRPSH